MIGKSCSTRSAKVSKAPYRRLEKICQDAVATAEARRLPRSGPRDYRERPGLSVKENEIVPSSVDPEFGCRRHRWCFGYRPCGRHEIRATGLAGMHRGRQ